MEATVDQLASVPIWFQDIIDIMYQRCGKKYTPKDMTAWKVGWWRDFGKYPKDILVSACKRIGENGTRYAIEWKTIREAIREVTPAQEGDGKQIGCTYCDSVGCIDYYVEKNGNRYQYSARCHKCMTSPYINLPFYNEVFPRDDIQPHSTPEQMECGKHIIEDQVRLITKREHEDYGQERERKRNLFIDSKRAGA